jgi:hypothetical protein
MFRAMLSQREPCLLHGDAMFLTSFVSAIKLSAEQVSESGHRNSKPIDVRTVFLGQPFPFRAGGWCSKSQYVPCTQGSQTVSLVFQEVSWI